MLALTILSGLLAAFASASPLRKRDDKQKDIGILQYALTLEHLEDAFYTQALAKYSAEDFKKAGFPDYVRKRFVQIGKHEQDHVDYLTAALGVNATKPCSYSFPYSDPKSFTALSMVLEGVGVSAYLGVAQYITNLGYLTGAAAILSTEARHSAWVSSAVNKGSPWSGPLDTPLNLDQVYSLAANFITSCPSTNPTIPVKAFPALTVETLSPTPGKTISLDFNVTNTGPLYLAFFSGFDTTFADISANKTVMLPSSLNGTVYAVVSSNGTVATDDTTVAGPVVFVFPDNE